MKCPACVAENAKSILRQDMLKERCLLPKAHQVDRFWCEEGHRHVHAHVVTKIVLTCSRQHSYQQRIQERCPHRDCPWNLKPTVLARDVPIGAPPAPPATPSKEEPDGRADQAKP